MLSFQNSYFEEEWREGFFVESKMKHAWAAELEVLDEIRRICEKHGLQYFATRGTLLGAIRHKGYIPWDDDVDIGMKRKDFQRFLEVAEKELPSQWVLVHVRKNKEWDQPFARLINGRKIDYTKEHLEQFHGCPYVVGVDIFPFDNLPKDDDEAVVIYSLMKILYGAIVDLQHKRADEAEEKIKEIESLMKVEVDRRRNIINQLFCLIDQISNMYTEEEASQLVQWHVWAYWDVKRTYEKEWYNGMIWMPFENTEVPVPVRYDEALRVMFGENYMMPIRGKAGHDYPFYKEQDKAWEEEQERRKGKS